MGQRKTYRSELRACAVEQHGYVTMRDVERLGVPHGVLSRLVERRRLVPVVSGLYRLDRAPQTRRDSFAEAVLRVGRDAVLSHDAVLALHRLTDREPDRVRVSTPHPVPRRLPGHVEAVRRRVGAQDRTTYDGIPSTTVTRALLDSRLLVAAGLLTEAADRAVERGLLLRRERHAVLDALEAAT